MGPFRSIGEFLRKLRLEKGIQSAAELGRRAKLGASHIAMFERGDVRPRWKTAEKLARALKLTAAERADFFRIIDAAGKPETVRKATSSWLPAEATIWKDLPALLMELPHTVWLGSWGDPEGMLSDVVQACASLLTRMILDMEPLRPADRVSFREELQQIVRTAQQSEFFRDAIIKVEPWLIAARAIPCTFRNRILGNLESARTLAHHIAEWSFFEGAELVPKPNMSIRLLDCDLQERWGVDTIEPIEVSRLHDAMTVHWLWGKTELSTVFGPLIFNPFLRRSGLGKSIRNLMEFDVSMVRNYVDTGATSPDPDGWTVGLCEFWNIVEQSEFSVRAFDDPDLIRMLVGDDFPHGRDSVLRKATEVVAALGEDPRERLRAAG